jgi:hypothetical protein
MAFCLFQHSSVMAWPRVGLSLDGRCWEGPAPSHHPYRDQFTIGLDALCTVVRSSLQLMGGNKEAWPGIPAMMMMGRALLRSIRRSSVWTPLALWWHVMSSKFDSPGRSALNRLDVYQPPFREAIQNSSLYRPWNQSWFWSHLEQALSISVCLFMTVVPLLTGVVRW